jgi:hypothetical protein
LYIQPSKKVKVKTPLSRAKKKKGDNEEKNNSTNLKSPNLSYYPKIKQKDHHLIIHGRPHSQNHSAQPVASQALDLSS